MIGSQNEITKMILAFRKRRDLMIELLNNISSISCIKPKGAFYAFANITSTGMGSVEFSEKILENAGVATCPGSYFGEAGEGYVRYCFANSEEKISLGLEKINHYLSTKLKR